jgi:hypothetical protein
MWNKWNEAASVRCNRTVNLPTPIPHTELYA